MEGKRPKVRTGGGESDTDSVRLLPGKEAPRLGAYEAEMHAVTPLVAEDLKSRERCLGPMLFNLHAAGPEVAQHGTQDAHLLGVGHPVQLKGDMFILAQISQDET